MFLPRASGAAERLSCVARTAFVPGVTAAQSFVSVYHKQSQQRHQRRYSAIRRPRLTRTQPKALGQLLFEGVSPPPLAWWRDFQEARGLGDLTPENCLSTFTQYCLVATNSGSTWKHALQSDHDIDPYTLHYTALPLINRSGSPAMQVGLHMLYTASSMGYKPSILTMMGLIARSSEVQYDRAQKSPTWREVEARFKRLLLVEKDPDVFTLQGLFLLREGADDKFALRYFDRAVEAARNMLGEEPEPIAGQKTPVVRKPRWTLENLCHKNRGAILLKQNRTDEARDAFRVLALELDFPDGYTELAKLLPHGAPKRETYLLKAAQAGNFEACRLLALDMADKAVEPDLPQADRVLAAGLAREWAMIEPDTAKREGLQAQVAEKTQDVFGK
ncbi:hypothetical protein P885DRAFT_65310 [Corynascus similis CBS 632.67]